MLWRGARVFNGGMASVRARRADIDGQRTATCAGSRRDAGRDLHSALFDGRVILS